MLTNAVLLWPCSSHCSFPHASIFPHPLIYSQNLARGTIHVQPGKMPQISVAAKRDKKTMEEIVTVRIQN